VTTPRRAYQQPKRSLWVGFFSAMLLAVRPVPITLIEDWTISFQLLGYATQSAGYFTVHEVAASSTKRLLPHKATWIKNLVESQSYQAEFVFDHKSDRADQP